MMEISSRVLLIICVIFQWPDYIGTSCAKITFNHKMVQWTISDLFTFRENAGPIRGHYFGVGSTRQL